MSENESTALITDDGQDDKLGLWSEQTLNRLKTQAQNFFTSGLAPKRFQNPLQIIVAASMGRELGLTFNESLKHIHVIEGIPALDANMQLALVRARCKTAKIRIIEQNEKACRISAWRVEDGDLEPEIFSYTHEEVPPFYFTGLGEMKPKANWINHEPDMLFARCATRMIRRKFSDILTSAYTPEELWEAKDAQAVVEAGGGQSQAKEGEPAKPGPMPRRNAAPKPEVKDEIIDTRQSSAEAEKSSIDVAEEVKEEADPIDQDAILELVQALSLTDKVNTVEMSYSAWRSQQNEKKATAETILHGYEVYNKRLSEIS
jgi:hypothetical protein